LTGVLNEPVVLRVLWKRAVESTRPSERAAYAQVNSVAGACWTVVVAMLTLGVHVTESTSVIGRDVRESVGNVRSTCGRPGYCVCDPPSCSDSGPMARV